MTQVSNPFSPLLVTFRPDRFFGRRSDIELILYGISAPEPRSFAVHGLKTIGKTTLLKYLGEPRGALTQYASLLLEYGPGRTGQLVFKRIDFYNITGSEVLPTLYKALIGSKEIYESLATDLITDLPEGADKSAIKTALLKILPALRTEHVRLVICLDHFDKAFQSMAYEDDVFLRNLTQDHAFIIATEKSLVELRKNIFRTSPLINVLISRNIGLLTEPEARELIETPAREVEPPLTEVEVTSLMQMAGRQPYLLIIACEFFFNLRVQYPELRSIPATEERVRSQLLLQMEALPAVTELFRFFWGQVIEEYEQNTLLKIATGGPLDEENDSLALKSLSQKALIEEDLEAGNYPLFSELFRNYLRQQRQPRRSGGIEAIASSLSPLDRKLLEYFLARPDQVCTFEELLTEVWGDPTQSKRALEAAVHRLRTKFQDVEMTDWEYIQNIRGIGYQYTPKPAWSAGELL